MPSLPFVLTEEEHDVIDVPVIEEGADPIGLLLDAAPVVAHRLYAGLRQPDDGPVRDCDGFAVHRIRVTNCNEMTCVVCGEVTVDNVCWTCGRGFDPAVTPMVPTISYLKPDEYEMIQRSW